MAAPGQEGDSEMTDRPEGLDGLLDFVADHLDIVETARELRAALTTEEWSRLVFKGSTVSELLDRIERYEKHMPSWRHGTPEEYDRWLTELTPQDNRLKFYQWIGHGAVGEAVYTATDNVSRDPVPVPHRYYTQENVYEFFELIDPGKDGGPFPSALPENTLLCNNPGHTHANGSNYLPICRVESE